MERRLKVMDAVAVVPKYNSHGKRDVTGAFLPEAKRFALLFDTCHIIQFDNRAPFAARRREVLGELERARDRNSPNTVAFFCHGWVDGIQAGFKRRHCKQLASVIRPLGFGDPIVPLYCCSTGDDEFDDPQSAVGSPWHDGCGPGEGSFADKLRDELCADGGIYCRVVAHETVGHTTRNPYVLLFDGMGSSYGGVGGYMPVAQRSKIWRAWKRALRKDPDFRFRFPYMTIEEIHNEL